MTEPTVLVKKKDGTTERVPLSSLHGNKSVSKKQVADDTDQKTKGLEGGEKLMEDVPSFIETNVAAKINPKKQESPKKVSQQKNTGDWRLAIGGKNSNNKKNIDVPQQRDVKKTPIDNHQSSVFSPKKEKQEVSTNLPKEATPHELTTTTPVDDFFVDLAKAYEWTKEDHDSPLEESGQKDMKEHIEKTQLPQSRFEDVQKIAEAIPFSIPQEMHSRLHSLIQSRLKDVRSDEQIRTYAMRETEHGGLGLTEKEAKTLNETIHSVLSIKQSVDIPGPRRTVSQAKHSRTPKGKTPSTESNPYTSYVSSSSKQTPAVSLKDIHPPKKQDSTMGPVDEIGTITLIDFRRLSQDPHSAIEVLREKMDTIRDESYLDYVKAQKAWYESPLYGMYLAYLGKALDEKQTLKSVLDKDITSDDVAVIAAFSESLRF
jgi:hypothetical protein